MNRTRFEDAKKKIIKFCCDQDYFNGRALSEYRPSHQYTFWSVTEYYRELDARNLYLLEYQDEVRELNPHLKERNYQLQPNDIITVQYVTKKIVR